MKMAEKRLRPQVFDDSPDEGNELIGDRSRTWLHAIQVVSLMRSCFDYELAEAILNLGPGEAFVVSFAAAFPNLIRLVEPMDVEPFTPGGYIDILAANIISGSRPDRSAPHYVQPHDEGMAVRQANGRAKPVDSAHLQERRLCRRREYLERSYTVASSAPRDEGGTAKRHCSDLPAWFPRRAVPSRRRRM